MISGQEEGRKILGWHLQEDKAGELPQPDLGTVDFGMENDYLKTEKMEWKNLGLDELSGTIKRTFGTSKDVTTDLSVGREMDVVQTFNENLSP